MAISISKPPATVTPPEPQPPSPENHDHLFVYGTLRPGSAPPEIASTLAALTPIATATVRATLHNLGDYPGIVLDPQAKPASGIILQLPTDPTLHAAALARLDDYEGFDPAAPATSLFRRVRTLARLSNGSQLACWVYVYNQAVPPPIPADAHQ